MNRDAPLVVQTDRTILLETDHPRFEEARARLSQFAELEKSPQFVHFYRMTPVSLWNAAALGVSLVSIVEYLARAARYPVAHTVVEEIGRWYERYGQIRFVPGDRDGALRMLVEPSAEVDKVLTSPSVRPFLPGFVAGRSEVEFDATHRGVLKHCLVKLGYPVRDEAGYRGGSSLAVELRTAPVGDFVPRDYQVSAAAAFWQEGRASGGCGVVVLPCGAGKTVVGLSVMALAKTRTLILTTNTVAVRQWRREILDRTSLRPADVAEYTGESKAIAPVTIATYQILTWRRTKSEPFTHFALLEQNDWGLVIYDEVHLLPAPVFRATATMQARRRLGLTATLVREDGREGDVFSLIGPKRYEMPWRDLERAGWLAAAHCHEIRVGMNEVRQAAYATASLRRRAKLAAENERKLDVVGALLRRHRGDRVLLIGQYLDQLRVLAKSFDIPLITGRTPNAERERLYAEFRDGRLDRLIVSKVGNFAIDLPDANVLIQLSGAFGSRQEEAQRLGRILRPKGEDGGDAWFYTVVTDHSTDLEFSARRQLFLAEQGYAYSIIAAEDLRPDAGSEEVRSWGA